MLTPRSRLAVGFAAFAMIACSDRQELATEPTASDQSPGVIFSATAGVPACGFENGTACPPLTGEVRCDAGLDLDNNGTPFNTADDRCIDDTRHLVGRAFRESWVHWALQNQRTLAIDEPINWVMHLSTHNAYNSAADAYILDPNQVWSMSDQLDVGARFLWLDLHWTRDAVRLCHEILCGTTDRLFAYGIKEVATWLSREENENEIVMFDLEAYVDGHFDEVANPLRSFFGTKLFEPTDKVGARWPSRRQLLAMGKQVIVGARGSDTDLGADNFGGTTHRNYIDGRADIRFIKNFEVTRTSGIVTSCGGRKVDDGGGLQPLGINDNTFWVVGEDRTVAGLFVGTGYVEGSHVRDLAACNVPLVSLDVMSGARCSTVPECIALGDIFNRMETEERQPYAVWSWRDGDRGAGDAALLHGSDGRWTSAPPSAVHRFACARPRSETTRNPADWTTDKLGEQWRLTTRAGPWREGGRACLDEFGDEGFVFSTPVNGRMNGHLRLADAARGDVWLNYNDIKAEGEWVINQRPVAHAGSNRVVECNGHHGTTVELDGSLSSDADGDGLTYEWTGPFGTATGVRPTVLLPLGRHVITLVTDDGFAGVDVAEVVIEVVDTTAPVIHSAAADPDTLWPPNHKMRPTVIAVDVTDICDASPTCSIVAVASNEPVNGVGDGNTEPDWQITGALTLNLRAERSGPGAGRIYRITVRCTDDSGNASTTEVLVTVPHDQGGGNRP